MYNNLTNRARSPQYGGFPNSLNQSSQYSNPFSYYPNGQQSPVNQPLAQRTFQYPQNTPPKGYQPLPSQRSNAPQSQPPSYPASQPSAQSISLAQTKPQTQQQQPQLIPQSSQQPQQLQQPTRKQETYELPPQQPNQIQMQQYPNYQWPSGATTLSLSGMRQQQLSPQYIPIQPVMTTVIQRPIEFVDLAKFEELWDKRIKELEDKIRQSQIQQPEPDLELRATNNEGQDELIKQLQEELYRLRVESEQKDEKMQDLKIELQTNIDLVEFLRQQLSQNGSDAGEITKLQGEIARLRHQVQTLEISIQQLNVDLRASNDENEQLRSQKQFFKDQCDEKEEFIQRLQQEIEEMSHQIETLTEEVTTSQSVKTFEEEAKIWRKKFKELNDTYHACQEKLMLTEAELDLMKRPQSQQKIVTTTVVKNNVITTSSNKSESDYLSSSLNQQDIEKLQNLQKNVQQI